jgi:dipeptidyl aminopeptidase/acylaminoacyl peptidase
MEIFSMRGRSVGLLLVLCLVATLDAQTAATRPVISEQASPFEHISPVAGDGHAGLMFLRKPPGPGPFPAVVIIHPGLTVMPANIVRSIADSAQATRFLAAGYVVATMTYRSRDVDPQSPVSLQDSLAVVDHLRKQPYVDRRSIALWGCSGGGDLAIEVAAATDIAALAPEEPASVVLTGIFNKTYPKRGEVYTPADAGPILKDPRGHYTAQYQKLTREKLGRITAPMLVLQGEPNREDRLNVFNAEVLVTELRALGKSVEVKSYAGEPHCFAFTGDPPRTPRPAVALQAWQDAEAFFRRHVPTKPVAMDPKLVSSAPLDAR